MYFSAGLSIECVHSLKNKRYPEPFEVPKFPGKFSWYVEISK
jgi:hypothetical protein